MLKISHSKTRNKASLLPHATDWVVLVLEVG